MSRLKCPTCGSSHGVLKTRNANFVSPRTGEKSSVKGVKFYLCQDCGEDWQTAAQFNEYRQKIVEVDYEWLSPKLIGEMRVNSPIPSKKELASFICVNEKAFTHWEKKGAKKPSPALDLLFRLVMHSRENFEFVRRLHRSHFQINKVDYPVCSGYMSTPKVFPKFETKNQDYLISKTAPSSGAVVSLVKSLNGYRNALR